MLQEYEKEVDIGYRLFHYVGKLMMNKQAYQIRLDIVAFIRDNQKKWKNCMGFSWKNPKWHYANILQK